MIRSITISKTAKRKIEKLFGYLVKNWNLKVKFDFVKKLNRSIKVIQLNPELFPESNIKKGLHKCVITKQTTLFYRFNSKKIIIVAIFDTRQNPNKLNKDL
ncbi:type II toxin-antitoxin system RelE/ParE family toxin [Polaribacter ponticola]|uniref:Type II toxin-antitoxin system RelE/ParE family toxin n=1 Tax=Polaribacter ponticola TaxID=2978475 RepID=A0ABT5S9D9_9FLAO|nr:type II toxin-antitoxin system RelE/ParE family toxin [Polaribacter sp. MSW5]MDD7914190.1 type II toxin-antitoxin system RelE/ParE family toxin [Polaribacter sp. MSW5]